MPDPFDLCKESLRIGLSLILMDRCRLLKVLRVLADVFSEKWGTASDVDLRWQKISLEINSRDYLKVA
jgi:hypothetical protein